MEDMPKGIVYRMKGKKKLEIQKIIKGWPN